MAWVRRTFECSFGHRWRDLVDRSDPPPTECPTCQAIVEFGSNNGPVAIVEPVDPSHLPARARSETQPAPAIRGPTTKAVERFESHAFKRPHFDDGSPLLTNLKDNNREGDIAAMPETVDSNLTMRMTRDMIEQQAQAARAPVQADPRMLQMGGGWQSPSVPAMTGGQGNGIVRPVVDLNGRRQA